MEPAEVFWSTHYTRHNQRRQEHLASLGLALSGQTVLEVGAAIGDHTSFFLDRDSTVVVTEAQEQNLALLRARYPELDVRRLDLNEPPREAIEVDIVYCYGTLYHLERPAEAIAWMARCATRLLLLETCVAAGEDDRLYPFDEQPGAPENAASGRGCRPTRGWVRRELAAHFSHVYVPLTQPAHEEFPLDWSRSELTGQQLIRGVFIASRQAIASPLLSESLPTRQVREVGELDNR
jgi:ubiquinone/menaquinone biosynthesis C-methylase UbiE